MSRARSTRGRSQRGPSLASLPPREGVPLTIPGISGVVNLPAEALIVQPSAPSRRALESEEIDEAAPVCVGASGFEVKAGCFTYPIAGPSRLGTGGGCACRCPGVCRVFPTQRVDDPRMSRPASLVEGDVLAVPGRTVTSQEWAETEKIRVSQRERQQIGSNTQEQLEDVTPLTLMSTQLRLMSHEELQRLAVVQCDNPSLIEPNGPNDQRMGTTDDNYLCYTCFQTSMDCPGHYGIIVLNKWYLKPLFIRQAIWILQAVCNSCGRLKVSREMAESQGILSMRGPERLERLAEIGSRREIRCLRVPGPGEDPCPLNPTYDLKGFKKDKYEVTISYEIPGSKGTNTKIQPIETIDKIFQMIPPEDIKILGLGPGVKPQDFILKSIPVIPPAARPTLNQDGEVKHDYLTTCYVDFIRQNNLIAQYRDPQNENRRKCAERDLWFFYTHFIDNSSGRYCRSADEPIQSIKQRMSQKSNGYIRGYSMGKRDDFTGRSVGGSESALTIDQVAIPQRMRRILTKPMVVTRYNQDYILRLYDEGKVTHLYPGSGKLKDCTIRIFDRIRERYRPRIGDRVNRHANENDEFIINRQPTIHRQGFMGHRGRFRPELTVGIHSSHTTPYNADFDGDEMNIQDIQTNGGRIEARTICSVRYNIMSAQNNRPSMGLVYNAISSAYMISQPSVFIEEEDWKMVLGLDEKRDPDGHLARITQPSTRRDLATLEERLTRHGVTGRQRRSGRSLFSALLPADFCYDSGELKIRDGILLPVPDEVADGIEQLEAKMSELFALEAKLDEASSILVFDTPARVDKLAAETPDVPRATLIDRLGLPREVKEALLLRDTIEELSKYRERLLKMVLTKSHVGPANGSIVHHIWKIYGRDRAAEFLTDGQYLLDWFIEQEVLTIGIKDCLPPNQRQIQLLVQRELESARIRIDALPPERPDMSVVERNYREKEIQSILNTVTRVGRVVGLSQLLPSNPLNVMTWSGAKGSESNTAQIMAQLGQQFINGMRPECKMSQGTRCMPYFPFGSKQLQGQGYIIHSFMEGIDPAEFVFHQQASRMGQINTSVKTAVTGHLHHRINKVLEDVAVFYDGSVRNGTGQILQYTYADGFNAAQLIGTKSKATGDLVSCIDLDVAVSRVNAQYGYY